MSDLATIRLRVRRRTGRISPHDISDEEIDEQINQVYLYDIPATIRDFSLETTFSFVTRPHVDQYDLRQMQISPGFGRLAGDSPPGSLESVADSHTSFGPPAYIEGIEMGWTQSRSRFFNVYGRHTTTTTGRPTNDDRTSFSFSFDPNPILQYQVTASVTLEDGRQINAVDTPHLIDGVVSHTSGGWKYFNRNETLAGSIDYTTGSGDITFDTPIPTDGTVRFEAVPYIPSRPQSLLFYENIIVLRPVPDKAYRIELQAFKRPVAMIEDGSAPHLKEWWQWIAQLTAIKIAQDVGDYELVEQLKPEAENQEDLVMRRTLVERGNRFTPTIFDGGAGGGGYGAFGEFP